jgi:hypothetical protein
MSAERLISSLMIDNRHMHVSILAYIDISVDSLSGIKSKSGSEVAIGTRVRRAEAHA